MLVDSYGRFGGGQLRRDGWTRLLHVPMSSDAATHTRARSGVCSQAIAGAVHAVFNEEYITWVRDNITPIDFDTEPAAWQHGWDAVADAPADAAHDVVLVTQASVSRCVHSICPF